MKPVSEVLKLSQEAIDFLSAESHGICFPKGSIILKRNSPGCFFVILSGEVEVRICTPDGLCMPLVKLGPHNTFGELSVLRNQPSSADVVALSHVTVLSYPAHQFRRALDVCIPLRDYILSRLAENLQDVRLEAWNFFLRSQAMNMLLESKNKVGPFISNSHSMKEIERHIKEEAQLTSPLLIVGPPGAGKVFIAQKLHEFFPEKQSPFTVFDCANKNSSQIHLALFGSTLEYSVHDSSNGLGNGLGALHLSNGGFLVLKHIESLPIDAQNSLLRYLETHPGSPIDDFPRTRIIATTSESLSQRVAEGCFLRPLFDLLSARQVRVPPLALRKHDILPLAKLFLLEAKSSKNISFTPQAEELLYSLKYSHRNVAELKDAVLLAAQFTEGNIIRADQIFTGPKDEPDLIEYDISHIRPVGWLTQTRLLPFVRWMTLLFFVGLLAVIFAAPTTVLAENLNLVIWGLWEPLLFGLYLLTGRLWCTICPLSSAGTFVQKYLHLDWSFPEFFKKLNIPFVTGGFLLILWSEHFWKMSETPLAAGGLLLTLFSLAIIFSILFKRQVWCRFLCPLGALGAAFSASSIFRVKANPSICASKCSTHDCYHGTREIPGCPVFHHPLYSNDFHSCKLCFNCLKSCPHDSARIYIRPPLQGIWSAGNFNPLFISFSVTQLVFTLFLLKTPVSAQISTFAFASFLLGLVSTPFIIRAFKKEAEHDPGITARIGFAWMVLSWGPLASYELFNLPWLKGLKIEALPSSPFYTWLEQHPLNLVFILQLFLILVSAIFSAFTFDRIRSRLRRLHAEFSNFSWNILFYVHIGYVLAAVLLVWTQALRN